MESAEKRASKENMTPTNRNSNSTTIKPLVLLDWPLSKSPFAKEKKTRELQAYTGEQIGSLNRVTSELKELILGLEEERASGDPQVGVESDKLSKIITLLARTPLDIRAVQLLWESFSFPLTADGACDSFTRAEASMKFLFK